MTHARSVVVNENNQRIELLLAVERLTATLALIVIGGVATLYDIVDQPDAGPSELPGCDRVAFRSRSNDQFKGLFLTHDPNLPAGQRLVTRSGSSGAWEWFDLPRPLA